MAKGTYRLSGGQREPPQLNWAGEAIREGEGYGGRPENIPETWGWKLAKVAAKQRHCAVTEKDVCEVFGNGSGFRQQLAGRARRRVRFWRALFKAVADRIA